MASNIEHDIFGSSMPKHEIGSFRHLQEDPTSDGRGVVIAILDTGVDPSAPGLQTTSDGRPKVTALSYAMGGDILLHKCVQDQAQASQHVYDSTKVSAVRAARL